MIITAENSAIYRIREYLPPTVSSALSKLNKDVLDRIYEIRLRENGPATVTIDGENYKLCKSCISKSSSDDIITSQEELQDVIYKFCKGSVYTHEATMSDFYISSNGIRIGMGASATVRDNRVIGLSVISSLNIRLPRHIKGCSHELYNYICENGFPGGKGILIISSPGNGKTTLLRDLAIKLSDLSSGNKAYRVCIIDERDEIRLPMLFDACCVDFISGLEKIKAMEAATRVLSPEVIICDEISSPDEAERIIKHKNGGTIFIASLHASDLQDALSRDFVIKMLDNNVFGAIYCLARNKSEVVGKLHIYREKND